MEIEYDLNREDLIEYNEHVFFSPRLRRKRAAGLLKLSVAFVLLGLVCIYSIARPLAIGAGVGLIVAAVTAPIMVLLLGRVRVRRQLEHYYPEGSNNAAYGPKRMELDAEGFLQVGKLLTMACKWQGVERVELTSRQVLVFISPVNALVIPRRAFLDEAALNEFVATARRYHREALERDGESRDGLAGQKPRSGGMK